jgi:parallel beta-helix repeat protein
VPPRTRIASLAVAFAVGIALTIAAGGCGTEGSPPPPRAAAAVAGASTLCDRVAAPGGSDRARGTMASPWRTVQRLVNRLRPGQRGCLRAGTYREDVAVGRSGIVLGPLPGERVTIVGRLWIRRRADDDMLVDLRLDGRNRRGLPSPTVNGDRATFLRVDVTDRRTGVCFLLGSKRYGRAQGTTIRASRIHGCGVLPAVNRQHGIYVDQADDTRIVDNVIYDNADRGIQLYPDAQRTVVRGNVIDGNGEGIIFSGDGRAASSGNVVEGNVITNSRIRADVESWYPGGGPTGRGNRVRRNCVAGGMPAVDASGGGFSATANVEADPRYRDRPAHDFRLAADSPCAALLRASRAPAGPAGQPPVG